MGVVSSCLPGSRKVSTRSKGVKVRAEEVMIHGPLATPNALENVLAKSLGLSCVLPVAVAVPLPLYVPVGVLNPRTGGLNKVDKLKSVPPPPEEVETVERESSDLLLAAEDRWDVV